jgi:hypothetical protein
MAVQEPVQEAVQEPVQPVREPVQFVQDAPNEGSLDVEMAPAGESVQEPVQESVQESVQDESVQEPVQDESVQDVPVQNEPVQDESMQEDVWEAAANRATEDAAQRLQGHSLADGVEREEVTPGALSRRPRSERGEGKGRGHVGGKPSRNGGRAPPILDRVRPRPR